MWIQYIFNKNKNKKRVSNKFDSLKNCCLRNYSIKIHGEKITFNLIIRKGKYYLFIDYSHKLLIKFFLEIFCIDPYKI